MFAEKVTLSNREAMSPMAEGLVKIRFRFTWKPKDQVECSPDAGLPAFAGSSRTSGIR